MSHVEPRVFEMLDLEIYSNYFLCNFSKSGYLETYPGSPPLDVPALTKILSKITAVTFNGNHFDLPLLTLATTGISNHELKLACNAIIDQSLKSWQFYQAYGLAQPDFIDHIDLIEVSPGQASLKAYGGKMHSRKIQDLPYPHDAEITPEQRPFIREYCDNDLATTQDLFETLSEQLKLRDDMSAEYGMDLRSKSDPQIAETILKSVLGFKVEKQHYIPGTVIRYTAPEYLKFQTPLMCNVFNSVKSALFVIGNNGSPMLPPVIEAMNIRIGSTDYALKIGGLHSCEQNISRYATPITRMRDSDVTGFYPNLMRNMGLYPKQIGPVFCSIFSGWIDTRTAEKNKIKVLQKELLALKKQLRELP